MTLHHDEVQAVGQREFGDLFLELLEVLGGEVQAGERQNDAEARCSHEF